jgi:hypothetical protein
MRNLFHRRRLERQQLQHPEQLAVGGATKTEALAILLRNDDNDADARAKRRRRGSSAPTRAVGRSDDPSNNNNSSNGVKAILSEDPPPNNHKATTNTRRRATAAATEEAETSHSTADDVADGDDGTLCSVEATTTAATTASSAAAEDVTNNNSNSNSISKFGKKGGRVHFGTVRTRTCNRIVGDHPDCEIPLAIGWNYSDDGDGSPGGPRPVTVDRFEQNKRDRNQLFRECRSRDQHRYERDPAFDHLVERRDPVLADSIGSEAATSKQRSAVLRRADALVERINDHILVRAFMKRPLSDPPSPATTTTCTSSSSSLSWTTTTPLGGQSRMLGTGAKVTAGNTTTFKYYLEPLSIQERVRLLRVVGGMSTVQINRDERRRKVQIIMEWAYRCHDGETVTARSEQYTHYQPEPLLCPVQNCELLFRRYIR